MDINSHKLYLEMVGVIANLETKLHKAREKSPKTDFKEQEFIIRVLKDCNFSRMELEEECRIMDKKYLKMANKAEFAREEMVNLAKQLKLLKIENDNLKQIYDPSM